MIHEVAVSIGDSAFHHINLSVITHKANTLLYERQRTFFTTLSIIYDILYIYYIIYRQATAACHLATYQLHW